jgi:hypothetical protein
MISKRLVQGIRRDGPVRRVPDGLLIPDDDDLRRFVPDAEPLGDGVGHCPLLDDENDAAHHFRSLTGETLNLCLGLTADRALRAMLENENGI